MDRFEDQQLLNISTNVRNIQSQINDMKITIAAVQANQEKMMTDQASFITQLSDKLSSIEKLDDSLFTLLSSLTAEISANKNDPEALDAILARVEADKTKLMNAVVANTPVVAPVAPVTDPAPTTDATTAPAPAPVSNNS